MKIYLTILIITNILSSVAFTQQLEKFSLDETAIRDMITGNTLTGRSTEGRFFSEYHLADGRVLGDNGYYQNTDACWTVKQNQVCYYYGEGANRTNHCFKFEKSNDIISLKFTPPNPRAGSLDAFAKIEKGNPRNHSDEGKTWHCDGFVSNLTDSRFILAQATPLSTNKPQYDFDFLTGTGKYSTNKSSNKPLEIGAPSLGEERSTPKTPLGAIPRSNEFKPKKLEAPTNNATPQGIMVRPKLPPGQIPQPTDKTKINPKPNVIASPSLNTQLPSVPLPQTQIMQKQIQPTQYRPAKSFQHPQPQFRAIPNRSQVITAPKALVPQPKFCPTGKSGC
jgi:hypothetical protein